MIRFMNGARLILCLSITNVHTVCLCFDLFPVEDRHLRSMGVILRITRKLLRAPRRPAEVINCESCSYKREVPRHNGVGSFVLKNRTEHRTG
jgi:hypothetical protein